MPHRESLLSVSRFAHTPDLRPACHTARRTSLLEFPMRSEYDFSQSRKNPYVKRLKRQITIRLDAAAIDHFKKMAADLGDALSKPHQSFFERLCHPKSAPHDSMARGQFKANRPPVAKMTSRAAALNDPTQPAKGLQAAMYGYTYSSRFMREAPGSLRHASWAIPGQPPVPGLAGFSSRGRRALEPKRCAGLSASASGSRSPFSVTTTVSSIRTPPKPSR